MATTTIRFSLSLLFWEFTWVTYLMITCTFATIPGPFIAAMFNYSSSLLGFDRACSRLAHRNTQKVRLLGANGPAYGFRSRPKRDREVLWHHGRIQVSRLHSLLQYRRLKRGQTWSQIYPLIRQLARGEAMPLFNEPKEDLLRIPKSQLRAPNS